MVTYAKQNINFLFVQDSRNKRNPWKYEAEHTLFSTLITIRNVSCVANHHIRVISEGSCDTEYWRNDAENSALITKYIHIKTHSKHLILLVFPVKPAKN